VALGGQRPQQLHLLDGDEEVADEIDQPPRFHWRDDLSDR
jgi:hypothetical protein